MCSGCLLMESSPAWALPVPWGHQTGDGPRWQSHGLAKHPAWAPWAGTGVTLGSGWWHRDAGTAGAHTGVWEVWCGGEVGAITVLK